jgi:hypothetical protein
MLRRDSVGLGHQALRLRSVLGLAQLALGQHRQLSLLGLARPVSKTHQRCL